MNRAIPKGYERAWVRLILELSQKNWLDPAKMPRQVFHRMLEFSEQNKETWEEGTPEYTGHFIAEHADLAAHEAYHKGYRKRIANLLYKMGRTKLKVQQNRTFDGFIGGVRNDYLWKEIYSEFIPEDYLGNIEWKIDYGKHDHKHEEGARYRWIVLSNGPGNRASLLLHSKVETTQEKLFHGGEALRALTSDLKENLSEWVYQKLVESDGTAIETSFLGNQWMQEFVGDEKLTAKEISVYNDCQTFGEFIEKFVRPIAEKNGHTLVCRLRGSPEQRFGINIPNEDPRADLASIKQWLVNDRGVPLFHPQLSARIFSRICDEMKQVHRELEVDHKWGSKAVSITPERRDEILNGIRDSLTPEFGEKYASFIWRGSLSPLHTMFRSQTYSARTVLRENCSHLIKKGSEEEEFDIDLLEDLILDWESRVLREIRNLEETSEISRSWLSSQDFDAQVREMTSSRYYTATDKSRIAKKGRKLGTVRGSPKREIRDD